MPVLVFAWSVVNGVSGYIKRRRLFNVLRSYLDEDNGGGLVFRRLGGTPMTPQRHVSTAATTCLFRSEIMELLARPEKPKVETAIWQNFDEPRSVNWKQQLFGTSEAAASTRIVHFVATMGVLECAGVDTPEMHEIDEYCIPLCWRAAEQLKVLFVCRDPEFVDVLSEMAEKTLIYGQNFVIDRVETVSCNITAGLGNETPEQETAPPLPEYQHAQTDEQINQLRQDIEQQQQQQHQPSTSGNHHTNSTSIKAETGPNRAAGSSKCDINRQRSDTSPQSPSAAPQEGEADSAEPPPPFMRTLEDLCVADILAAKKLCGPANLTPSDTCSTWTEASEMTTHPIQTPPPFHDPQKWPSAFMAPPPRPPYSDANQKHNKKKKHSGGGLSNDSGHFNGTKRSNSRGGTSAGSGPDNHPPGIGNIFGVPQDAPLGNGPFSSRFDAAQQNYDRPHSRVSSEGSSVDFDDDDVVDAVVHIDLSRDNNSNEDSSTLKDCSGAVSTNG